MRKTCNICGAQRSTKYFPTEGHIDTCKRCRKKSSIAHIRAEKKKLQKSTIRREHYNRKFVEQNGSCYICGRHQDEFDKRLSLDHNHSTGELRGLLCQACNVALGYTEENISRLTKMIEYIMLYNDVKSRLEPKRFD